MHYLCEWTNVADAKYADCEIAVEVHDVKSSGTKREQDQWAQQRTQQLEEDVYL